MIFLKKIKSFLSSPVVLVLVAGVLFSGYNVLRKYYMDEFTLKGKRVADINNGILSNSDSSLPTSQSVYNAILSASFDPASGLKNWFDITDYGGVADGGYGGGTDNTPAFIAAYNAAVPNSVIYIPSGSYRFYETIRLNNTFGSGGKRVFIVSYGNLYFGSDTAFIFDGSQQRHWFNGNLYGTNQFGTINYGSQTNPGIYMRNLYNSEIYVNAISGFKYAIKCGGYAGGNQYNKIVFTRLEINSVGIHIEASGPTSNGPRWSNENTYIGGQITADTGIVFQKDPNFTSPDRYNGNKFYSIGFEYRGNNEPMRVGIKADWATNNQFITGRIEPIGVTTKFDCTGDVNTTQFIGWYMQDSWLINLGYGASVYGAIYGNSGDLIGNQAQGYPFGSSDTYYNGRFKVYGLRWGFTAAAQLSSNIDIDWILGTDATTTSATYTVARGIKFVKVNYASGTNTTTLPTASTRANDYINIKNMNGTNSVTVSGPIAGSITSIPPYGCVSYYSDGDVWIDAANNFATGGGGSSQWINDGSNIRYPNRVKIVGTTATASLHIGNRGTPAVSGSGPLKIDAGTLMTAPENGLFENDGANPFFTTENTRAMFITTKNISTVTFPSGTIAVVNDANYTVASGVNAVVYSASTGTKTLTIPAASGNANREITIKNAGASSISIPVGYYITSGSPTTTLAAGTSIRIKSTGSIWWAL